MYELSRRLYRDLKPLLMPSPGRSSWHERALLTACEDTVALLASDATPAAPSRHLFAQVRGLFPAAQQLRVRGVIETRMAQIRARIEERRGPGGASLLRCAASNRRGKPCGREPLRGGRYCPSHQHLADMPGSARVPASIA